MAQERLGASNRELESRVDARTQELQQALADRDSFVSVVSHELRTPLTALKLNQDALQRVLGANPLDLDSMHRLFGALPRQLSRVQRLVDDLLDVSRLSTDQMRYVREPTELKRLVDESVEQLAPQLAIAHADFAVEAEEGLTGNWDRTRVEQVLVNLMSNALRYGRPPFSIVARRVDRNAEIVVRDEGEGIAPENLRRVFEPFQRASGERKSAGLGLGLYIAERIVRAHEGTIRAESATGRGTAFIVELPLA
jgi:signal transduction histidine kinase